MRGTGIKPEPEVFNSGHFSESQNLFNKELLGEPIWCSLVLGMQTGTPPTGLGRQSSRKHGMAVSRDWSTPTSLTSMALNLGGYIRAGMENSAYYQKGIAENNPHGASSTYLQRTQTAHRDTECHQRDAWYQLISTVHSSVTN